MHLENWDFSRKKTLRGFGESPPELRLYSESDWLLISLADWSWKRISCEKRLSLFVEGSRTIKLSLCFFSSDGGEISPFWEPCADWLSWLNLHFSKFSLHLLFIESIICYLDNFVLSLTNRLWHLLTLSGRSSAMCLFWYSNLIRAFLNRLPTVRFHSNTWFFVSSLALVGETILFDGYPFMTASSKLVYRHSRM